MSSNRFDSGQSITFSKFDQLACSDAARPGTGTPSKPRLHEPADGDGQSVRRVFRPLKALDGDGDAVLA